jgi:hypothetical protein
LVHEETAGALPLTRPDVWTPHVTLARRVPHHLLGKAVELLEPRLEAGCPDVRLWDSSTKTVTSIAGKG